MKKQSFIGYFVIAALLVLASSMRLDVVSAQDDDPIVVSVAPFMSYLPLYIADEYGYFADEGLDVELIVLPRGEDSFVALAQGRIDAAGSTPGGSIFNAIARGSNMRIVADKGSIVPDQPCSPTAVLVNQRLIDSGEYTGLADFAGKEVDINPTSITLWLLEDAFAEAGVTYDDMTFTDIPAPLLIEGMAQGNFFGGLTGEPAISQITSSGIGSIAIGIEDYIEDRFPISLLIFSGRLLEDEDAGEAFMRAYVRGIETYNEGLTEENLALFEDVLGIEREVLEVVCLPSFAPDGSIHTPSIMNYQQWMVDNDFVDEVIPEENLFNFRFIEAVMAEEESE